VIEDAGVVLRIVHETPPTKDPFYRRCARGFNQFDAPGGSAGSATAVAATVAPPLRLGDTSR